MKLILLVFSVLIAAAASTATELPAELRAKAGSKGLALILRDGSCPISKKYGPRLKEMESRYRDKGITFIYVYVGPTHPEADAAADRNGLGLSGESLVDADRKLVAKLGARVTTETFVFDKDGRAVYRGPVDDQHRFGESKVASTNGFLPAALESLVKGARPNYSETDAAGCAITYKNSSATVNGLTFNQDIQPLIQAKCLLCHTKGGHSEYDISTYKMVRAKAGAISQSLRNHLMPPWYVKPGLGPFLNDFSLDDESRLKFLRWLESEQLEGPPVKNRPATVGARKNWALGAPDLTIRLPKAVDIPAQGFMPYQKFIIKTGLKTGRWIKSYEIQVPPEVVHHVVVFVLKDDDPGKDFWTNSVTMFIKGIGNIPQAFPEGAGVFIPANAVLGFLVHYEPIGKPVLDKTTRIGFRFAKGVPNFEAEVFRIEDWSFSIPAGQADFRLKTVREVNEDFQIYGLVSHMHLRGKSAQINLIYPDGRREALLDIDPFKFGHQVVYQYQSPKQISKGSKIECLNNYDNSADNPLNPDPSVEVKGGEKITDEMNACFLHIMKRRKG